MLRSPQPCQLHIFPPLTFHYPCIFLRSYFLSHFNIPVLEPFLSFLIISTPCQVVISGGLAPRIIPARNLFLTPAAPASAAVATGSEPLTPPTQQFFRGVRSLPIASCTLTSSPSDRAPPAPQAAVPQFFRPGVRSLPTASCTLAGSLSDRAPSSKLSAPQAAAPQVSDSSQAVEQSAVAADTTSSSTTTGTMAVPTGPLSFVTSVRKQEAAGQRRPEVAALKTAGTVPPASSTAASLISPPKFEGFR